MSDTGTVAFECSGDACGLTFIRPVERVSGENWRFTVEDADRCPECQSLGTPISERVHQDV